MVDLNLEEVRLPNGRAIQLEIIRHSGAAAAVPLKDDGNVVLVRQFRYAAGGMIYEIPAGRLEPGEAPLDCASREMKEEAGWEAQRWDRLGAIWTTPGFTDEKIHLFLARGLVETKRALEQDEVIEVLEIPLDRALAMVQRGEIQDGKTICALSLAAGFLKAGGGPEEFRNPEA